MEADGRHSLGCPAAVNEPGKLKLLEVVADGRLCDGTLPDQHLARHLVRRGEHLQNREALGVGQRPGDAVKLDFVDVCLRARP